MPISAAQTQLQSRVQSWAKNQGIDKPVHDLSLGQLQKASRSLDVSLQEVVDLREALTQSAADKAQAAGDKFAATRDAAQGAALGFGGGNAATSPLLVGHTWSAKGAASVGKGKGAGSPDSDLAMTAMSVGRFANNVQVRQPFVDYKGYRGGSDNLDTFFRSTYSVSDAAAAMKAFGLNNVAEAKDLIGAKVASGNTSALEMSGITPHAFDKHECIDAFDDSAYTLRDARRAVAEFPFLHSVADAKEYIGLKIVNGTEDILSNRGIGGQRMSDVDLFHAAGYTYDDAAAAVQAFSFLSDVGQAKAYIGMKVANGYEKMLRDVDITPGNFDSHEMIGAFNASRYSGADAEQALKAFDFLHTMKDAQEYIGLKVINGTENILADQGITQAPFDRHEELSAFRRSGYSETDARATLMAFDFLGSVADAKEYIGLKVINGNEGILADVGVTRQDWDAHECVAAFAKAGYTNADADAAAAGWGFLSGRDEAREYIGLKVLNGMEHMLAEVGVSPRNFNNAYDFKVADFKSSTGYWDQGNIGYDAKGYDKAYTGLSKGGVGYAKNWDYK